MLIFNHTVLAMGQTQFYALYIYSLITSSQPPNEADTINILISQTRKLRHGKIKRLAQADTSLSC